MIDHLLCILWDPDLEVFRIGNFTVRWYSTCWLIGLALAYFIVRWPHKDQKVKDAYFDPLFIYCFLGILIGARLGYCLFYQPEYFLSSWTHVVEMFLPIHRMADGSWKFIGYEGLASHGGTIGFMVALYLHYRKTGMNLWHVLDGTAIATPITACFIHLGNLTNNEIIGIPTNVPWVFIFGRVDMTPRHPGQLCEAIAYFFLFFVMLHFYKRTSREVGTGFYFGLCLALIFTFRFLIEYTKDIQVDFESGMTFNMGQLLNIPFIILGIACMRGGKWVEKLGTKRYFLPYTKAY